MNHTARSRRIRIATEAALRRFVPGSKAAVPAWLDRHIEAMETRVLLSAYLLNTLGYDGSNASGNRPVSPLVVDSNGNFYGTNWAGGQYGVGTVFEIASGSTAITTLASFNGATAKSPGGSLAIDGSGNLYGTAWSDSTGFGTIFEVAKGSKAVTALASFNGNGNDSPVGVTMDASGNLFGVTLSFYNDGTVFELAKGSTSITTLASFNGTNGQSPSSGVTLDAAGNLFGTTGHGAANGLGGVFEVAKGSTTITLIASFTQSGGYSAGPVTVDAAGNIFGTTATGGYGNAGTAFEIANGSSTVSTLAMFSVGTGGYGPGRVTLDASGDLLGTTSSGGAYSDGTIFELPKASTSITTLASFNGTNGAGPSGAVTLDAAGNLFGTTNSGGANGNGMVFELAAGSQSIMPVASFEAVSGTPPTGNVAVDASGNVFGTTSQGGPANDGTVFEIANGSNAMTTIASFNGANGWNPLGGLTQDPAGNLYGTTEGYSGASPKGSVFEIAKGSTSITTLAFFNGTNGWGPDNGLTIDAAGNVYGTTPFGGANSAGTIFEIASGSNTITDLVSFTSGVARSQLAVDASGNLYGIYASTPASGNGTGTVFEIGAGTGMMTTLATFSLFNGSVPGTMVALDAAGNLYGTTTADGSYRYGIVFEVAKGSGKSTTLATFDGNGSTPSGGVTIDPSGNLFGTTSGGGYYGLGTVFELPKGSGTITALATFNRTNGSSPNAGITLVGQALYGTTSKGGPANLGTVFKLSIHTTLSVTETTGSNPSYTDQTLVFTAAVSGGVPDGQQVTLVDSSNGNSVVTTGSLSGGVATLPVPAGALSVGNHHLIALYAGDSSFDPSQYAWFQQVYAAPAPPALWGAPVINGDNPNRLYYVAGQPTPGVQRSMVEDVVYSFNESVTIPDVNKAFTVQVAGQVGGTVPSTLLASAVPGSNGTRWAVSLTGQPVGTLASIANGEYSITINPNYVFAADGLTTMAPGTGRTDTFFRLYGDVTGDGRVNNADYNAFLNAYNTQPGQFGYNAAFDLYGSRINNADYNLFLNDFNMRFTGFTTTI